MKNIRFYEEFKDSRKRNSCKTVVAIYTDSDSIRYNRIDAIVGVYDVANSLCCFTSVSSVYLKRRCKRISEQQAKQIHPNLFVRLEEK